MSTQQTAIYKALSPTTGEDYVGFFINDGKRINIVFAAPSLADLQSRMSAFWEKEQPKAARLMRAGAVAAVEGAPSGKLSGKTGMNAGTKWINKGAKRIRVPADQVAAYIKKGWRLGK